MIDRIVSFFDLFMLHPDLAKVVEQPLPPGYSFRFFNGTNEDITHWVEIEVSSGDVSTTENGYKSFDEYYGSYINELKDKCLFVLNSEGKPIGTATAFFLLEAQPAPPKVSIHPEKIPENVTGHLHWVAIKEEYQGKGLSKPMITRAMKIMLEYGHSAAFLHTQTPSWVACKVYQDLGWKPFRFVQTKSDFEAGWRIVTNKIFGRTF